MKYVQFYNLKGLMGKIPSRRTYRRINARTVERVPFWGNLVVRNGCPVWYKGGYLTPIDRFMFGSAQEVSDFLHTDGRKGLYRITQYSIYWNVVKCVQMPTKKQALAKAAEHGFDEVYSWKDNEDIFD